MRFQRDAMALTLARDVADFTATARQALRTETKQAMSDDEIAHVLEGFSKVPASPDAVPALRKLSEAEVTRARTSRQASRPVRVLVSRARHGACA